MTLRGYGGFTPGFLRGIVEEDPAIADFLETQPGLLYDALRPRVPSYNVTDWWRKQGQNVFDQYQAATLGGTLSQQTFLDYLGEYPFLEEWYRRSPRERGQGTGLLAPRMQWQV